MALERSRLVTASPRPYGSAPGVTAARIAHTANLASQLFLMATCCDCTICPEQRPRFRWPGFWR